MVSLANERRRGGQFFDQPDHSTSFHDSDELLVDTTTLSTGEEPPFRQIHTVPVIVVLIILVVAQEVLVIALPFVCSIPEHGGKPCGLESFAILVYCHASLWFFIMIADRYLRVQHYISRTAGYLEFYRKTRHVRRMPFMVSSAGNAILLIVLMLLHDNCSSVSSPYSCTNLGMSWSNFLRVIISVEFLVTLPFLLYYLVKTVDFNKKRAAPDVHCEDLLTALQPSTQPSEVGFRDEDFVDDVLERQADLIRYLKQHNANLGRRILQLNAQLSERKV